MSVVRETLSEFFERVFENMNIMARNVETLNRIRLELVELEVKAQELDRREKGCTECKTWPTYGFDFCPACGKRIVYVDVEFNLNEQIE